MTVTFKRATFNPRNAGYTEQQGAIAGQGPGFSASEIGDVTETTIEVIFNQNVNSVSGYDNGVTIRVNGIAATISSGTRQDPTNNLVYYVIASPVDINDTVTWEYDDDFGDIEDDEGDPMIDISAQAVTNYVGAYLWFDSEENSAHLAHL